MERVNRLMERLNKLIHWLFLGRLQSRNGEGRVKFGWINRDRQEVRELGVLPPSCHPERSVSRVERSS